MSSITLKKLSSCHKFLKRYYFFRSIYQKAPNVRHVSVENVGHDETNAPESSNLDRTQINISNEELEMMYKKNIYNSDVWDMVVKHKIDTFKLEKNIRRRPLPTPYAGLSVAAKTLMESSGYNWDSIDNDIKAVMLSEQREVNQYPFLPADIEKRRDELLQMKRPLLSDNVTIQNVLGTETLPAIPDTFSTDRLSSQSSTSTEKAVDTITLLDPHQKPRRQKSNDNKNPNWRIMYGTPDPSVPITDVPCGGCGALLHCQDSGISGYLPSELLTELTKLELQDVICQRCTFLKDYNIALNLSVSPEVYPEIISKIRGRNALVVLMVDLLDFPCSLWPGIIDLIGPKQSILVVGNKVDLLPKEGKDYLSRVKNSLCFALKECGIDQGGNIKNICLISAKTGYGIEDLITEILANWGASGDMYLVGCTNVGKSSLFNVLLQSDMCKAKAMDLIQRATVSIWPGTTLNLLKFPVLRSSEWRLFLRQKRLKTTLYAYHQEQKLRKYQLKRTGDLRYASLIGHVGLTFKTLDIHGSPTDAFKLASGINSDIEPRKLIKFNPEAFDYKEGKWLYDTPGTIHKDQIINLLTMEELSWTIPKKYIQPRCFLIKPGHTFFLAGLGRIDYFEGSSTLAAMVFSSSDLPVSIMCTKFANDFYNKYLGTKILKVPHGSQQRLKDFPNLFPKKFTVTGDGMKYCSADIVLSSAGWVSLSLTADNTAKILAYTPGGRGCYMRDPPLLKYAVQLRGKRKVGTPACEPSLVYVENN